MSINPSARELRTQANREKVSRAAMNLYEKYSFDEVSVADICQACQISTGSFYHLFGSKENTLFLSVAAKRDQYLQEHFTIDESVDFPTQFYDFVMVNIEYNLSVPKQLLGQTYSAYVTQKCVQPLQTGRPYCDMLDCVVRRGLRLDAFLVRMNHVQLYRFLNAMIIGIAEDWCAHDAVDQDDLCRLFAKEMIRTILKPPFVPRQSME